MTRTNVDIDDSACASIEEARALRGVGWEGNLDTMRSNRSP